MNYETSPVSIKKRKPKKNENKSSSSVLSTMTKSNSVSSTSISKDIVIENGKPPTNASETPARSNSTLCESPQFLEVAESPEFRVGWDDGFETEKPNNKINLNENGNGSKRKSKRKVLNARTLRSQRILSNTQCQTEANHSNTCDNDHPESDEFLAWAQSLLCAPPVEEPVINSPLNSSVNQSLNNTENQSPKPNPMKTPKRPSLLLNHSSPSSNSSMGVYRTLRRKSYNGSTKPVAQQESPLAKFSNNNNIETDKEDLNDFFNDSVNELMIKCSQAVENKLNSLDSTKHKGNESLNVANLLDDSANDLILACTQQVEDKLFNKQNVCDKTETNSTNTVDANINNSNRSNQSKVQARKQENNVNIDNKANVNTRRQFVPKQNSNLHKLDCPNAIEFDSPNVISRLSEKLINKSFGQPDFKSPNSLSSKRDSSSSSKQNPLSFSTPSTNKNVKSSSKVPEKSATKHFLSPNTKEETSSSRKRFCYNNNEMAYNGKVVATSSNQDLTSILNEDEDMLCNLDMDQVLSQVPSTKLTLPIQPTKPYPPPVKTTQSFPKDPIQQTFLPKGKMPQSFPNTLEEPIQFLPKTKIPEESSRQTQSSQIQKPVQKSTSISFNGYKPNPVILSKDLKINGVKIQQTVPINGAKIPQTLPINGVQNQQSIVPIGTGNQPNNEIKYTQEQIQMKKIEAKRRLALNKRQKSFEIK